MKIDTLLFVVNLAFCYIGYGSSQTATTPAPYTGCLTVEQICDQIWPQFPTIITCICNYAGTGYYGATSNPSLKAICNGLTAATDGTLKCSDFSLAVNASNDCIACEWLGNFINPTNGTGPLAELTASVGTLIDQLIANLKKDPEGKTLCEILSCVLNILITFGYYTNCLVISAIKQINAVTGKAPTCLCDYLIAFQIQHNLLENSISKVIGCNCLSPTVSISEDYGSHLIPEFTNLVNMGYCTGLPPLPNTTSSCPGSF